MDSDVLDLSEALEEKLQQFEKDQKLILREQLRCFRTAVQRVVELHGRCVIEPLQQENLSLHSQVAHLQGTSNLPLRWTAMQREVPVKHRPIESPAVMSQETRSCDSPKLINSQLSTDVVSPRPVVKNTVSFQMGSNSVTSLSKCYRINSSSHDDLHGPSCNEDSDSAWMPLADEWDTGGAPHITMFDPPLLEPPSGRKRRDLMLEMHTPAMQQPPESRAEENPHDEVLRQTTFSMITVTSAGTVEGQATASTDLKLNQTDSAPGSAQVRLSSKLERLEVAMDQVNRVTRVSDGGPGSHERYSGSQPMIVANQTLSGQACSIDLAADDFYLLQMWHEHLSIITARVNDPTSSFDGECTQSSGGFLLWRKERLSPSRMSVFVPSQMSRYLVTSAQSFVLSPCSGKRLWWDVTSMILTLYDLIMIPLAVFDPPETAFITFMFWFTIVFWTCDIGLSFFTGVQTNQGMEMRLHRIAVIYTKSWMAIDILILAPDWTMFFANHADQGGDSGIQRLGKLLKVARFARTMRLLRILRFTRALSCVQDRLKSGFILHLMDFGKLAGGLAFLNHYLSCFWFLIGKMQEDGWVDKYSMRNMSRKYQYLTSMHWSISQFHGSTEIDAQTSWERLISIASAFLGLILASLFISSITNLIMRMQKLHQETFLKNRKLLRYLNENGISQNLTWRIKRFTRLTANANVVRLQDVELLNTLPAHLLEEIMVETKAPGLQMNAVLKHCVDRLPQTKKQLCQEVLSEAIVNSGGLVFGHAEKSGQMFLIVKGEVMYHPNMWEKKQQCEAKSDTPAARFSSSEATTGTFKSESMPSKIIHGHISFKAATRLFRRQEEDAPEGLIESEMKVVAGQFISEMNLWTTWAHRGDCVLSGCATIFSVDATGFGEVMKRDKNHSVELALDISHYATQYVHWLNAFGVPNQYELHDCSFPPDLGIDNSHAGVMMGKSTSLPRHIADRLKGFMRKSTLRIPSGRSSRRSRRF